MKEKKICTCTDTGTETLTCDVHIDLKARLIEHDFDKYGFDYLDDTQVIMMALIWQLTGRKIDMDGDEPSESFKEYSELINELKKRSSKQRMHIPIFEREKKCSKKN